MIEVFEQGTKVPIGDGVVGRVIGVLVRGNTVQYDVEYISGSDYKSAYMHSAMVEELVGSDASKRSLGFKVGNQ